MRGTEEAPLTSEVAFGTVTENNVHSLLTLSPGEVWGNESLPTLRHEPATFFCFRKYIFRPLKVLSHYLSYSPVHTLMAEDAMDTAQHNPSTHCWRWCACRSWDSVFWSSYRCCLFWTFLKKISLTREHQQRPENKHEFVPNCLYLSSQTRL